MSADHDLIDDLTEENKRLRAALDAYHDIVGRLYAVRSKDQTTVYDALRRGMADATRLRADQENPK